MRGRREQIPPLVESLLQLQELGGLAECLGGQNSDPEFELQGVTCKSDRVYLSVDSTSQQAIEKGKYCFHLPSCSRRSFCSSLHLRMLSGSDCSRSTCDMAA